MRIDGERLRTAFKYIVQGLYFKLRGKRLPVDCKFDISRVDRLHAEAEFREAYLLQPKNYRRIGEGIFDCMFFYAAEDEVITRWELVFYNAVLVRVETEPFNGTKHLVEPVPDR
jgi:hypothetical protein